MVAISKAEQNKRWRKKYPEKAREQKRKYLERKILKNPENLEHLRDKLRQDFALLTRLTFNDILIKSCEVCGSTEELQIHHKRYVYPIIREDLIRLCSRCHFLEHQKLPSPTNRVTVSIHMEN
jgi:hypothetical protein